MHILFTILIVFMKRKYLEFVELDYCIQSDLFKRLKGEDSVGCQATLIEVLVLSASRTLGLGPGLTFDYMEELTLFLKKYTETSFIPFLTMVDGYVAFPSNSEKTQRHMKQFAMAGIVGLSAT